ncbi:MAG TPA: hypothetical protein DD671_00150 [Balneolaceae bacterium]|nr:hypothetical protein [Balneola sp.]HBQ58071.1 hypothetical protein [Balneolaceae bacterium]|tara:strand:- start:88061 stop:88420 length:360 start_codon:yes stop_codon:yes gene_type:complete
MSPIHELLSNINRSSSVILHELDGNEPSFEVITEELNQREQLVSKLSDYQDQYSASSFDGDALNNLKQKFDTFTVLNKDIQGRAEQLLQLQKEKMATATKQLKAEQQYKSSRTPNISYF